MPRSAAVISFSIDDAVTGGADVVVGASVDGASSVVSTRWGVDDAGDDDGDDTGVDGTLGAVVAAPAGSAPPAEQPVNSIIAAPTTPRSAQL